MYSIGMFDAVVASNLLCRLPSPRKFLQDIASFIQPGGSPIILLTHICLLYIHTFNVKEEYFTQYGMHRRAGAALSVLLAGGVHRPGGVGRRLAEDWRRLVRCSCYNSIAGIHTATFFNLNHPANTYKILFCRLSVNFFLLVILDIHGA